MKEEQLWHMPVQHAFATAILAQIAREALFSRMVLLSWIQLHITRTKVHTICRI